MNTITLHEPRAAAPDTHVITSYFPAPGYGLVPINAFVLHAPQPVLIDTQIPAVQEGFIRAVQSVLPLNELRWIWLTHTDPDHIGSLQRLLALAPQARVVTTFIGMAKLSLFSPLPPERIFLLNPGQELDVGDRRLRCLRPPTFDAPETTGLFDGKTRVLFSSDSFGAMLQEPAETAQALDLKSLRDGITLWASLDAPWLQLVTEESFRGALDAVRSLSATTVLSSHLPPAQGITESLITLLAAARAAPAFVGPDQAQFSRMMAVAA